MLHVKYLGDWLVLVMAVGGGCLVPSWWMTGVVASIVL